jgi:Lipocalin-like domain
VSNVHGREALVGAWQLLSWENRADDGQVTYPMGTDALGSLLYTAAGRFASRSRGGVGPGSPPATCSAGPPRSRPGS